MMSAIFSRRVMVRTEAATTSKYRQGRNSQHGIGRCADDHVDASAKVTGNQTEARAQGNANQPGQHTHLQRLRRAGNDDREHIAAAAVRSQRMLGGGRFTGRHRYRARLVHINDVRADEAQKQKRQQKGEAQKQLWRPPNVANGGLDMKQDVLEHDQLSCFSR